MLAVVGGNDSDVMHGFVEQRHILLVLNDLHGVKAGGLIEGAGNAREMAPSFGIFVSASQTVHAFGLSFRGVFVARRRRTASSAAWRGSSISAAATPCAT